VTAVLVALPLLLWHLGDGEQQQQQQQRQGHHYTLLSTMIPANGTNISIPNRDTKPFNLRFASKSDRSRNEEEIENERRSSGLINPEDNRQEKLSSVDGDPSLLFVVPPSIYEPSSSKPLQVIFLGNAESIDGGGGVLLEGLERSKYIKVCSAVTFEHQTEIHEYRFHSFRDDDVPIVVVVDWSALSRDCHVLERLLTNLQQSDDIGKYLLSAHMLLVDLSARSRMNTCPNSSRLAIPEERIHTAQRPMVVGRYWSHASQWVKPGHLISATTISESSSHQHVMHMPGMVRENIAALYRNHTVVDSDPAEDPRTIDVALFAHEGEKTPYSFLLRKVSSVLISLNGTKVDGQRVRVLAKLASDEATYIQHLLASKIVVVTQKDEWEDHGFALTEAMASGAMLMVDSMVVPPGDLKHKTNVVFYDSASHLESLIRYYLKNEEKRLAIARHGVEYALGRHRPWHVVESLLFGKALTRTDKPYEEPPARRRRNTDQISVVA
jgi:hypothetical protein